MAIRFLAITSQIIIMKVVSSLNIQTTTAYPTTVASQTIGMVSPLNIQTTTAYPTTVAQITRFMASVSPVQTTTN